MKKQAEDIDMLIERMDEQVKQLTKAYRDELEEIEVSIYKLIFLSWKMPLNARIVNCVHKPVADPGFPVGGRRPIGGAPTSDAYTFR